MPYADKNSPEAQASLRKARRKHYAANKEQYFQRNAEARERKRAFILESRNKPCTDCGGVFPLPAMQHDHLSDKWKNVSALPSASWRQIREEIAKCEVVCANCHAIRTDARFRSCSG